MANKGKAIDPRSEELKDLAASLSLWPRVQQRKMNEETEQKKAERMEKMKENMPKRLLSS